MENSIYGFVKTGLYYGSVWLKIGIAPTAFGGSLPYRISVKYVERFMGDTESTYMDYVN
jgi:hypothetical protein